MKKIKNNEILIGELIVPTQFLRFAVDKTTKTYINNIDSAWKKDSLI